jgi:uncharacterized protein
MQFTQDSNSARHIVRGYGAGELRINDTVHRGAIVVSAGTLLEEPGISTLEALVGIDTARIMALEPELVLLGTGARHIFPPAAFAAAFLSAGIGFEAMNTGAACRTYNVLVGEQRRVVAILLA